MWYLVIKAALSGTLIAIISDVAKRYPGFGGLIASLPLVSGQAKSVTVYLIPPQRSAISIDN